MDCLTKMSRASFKRINNNYYKDNKYSTTITLVRADPPTPAKGNTPAREISPFTGGSVSILSSALPYPSFPALCRKDTTYPWSNRLRSHYNIVMMMVMMMMMVMIMVMMKIYQRRFRSQVCERNLL